MIGDLPSERQRQPLPRHRSKLIEVFLNFWVQDQCGRKLSATSFFNRDLKNQLQQCARDSIRRFNSNPERCWCGSWRESCSSPPWCSIFSVSFYGGALCSRN